MDRDMDRDMGQPLEPLHLIIANRRYSSWSMRPWLALKHAGLPFTETVIPLRQPDTRDTILRHSSSGKVPILRHGAVTVWDSLAILEYLAELAPQAGLWPVDAAVRAVARSAAAEMHSGFMPLRQNMPMNLAADLPGCGRTPEVLENIARIDALWCDLRATYGAGGPFLFGAFTNVDAMFAPVVCRFKTYGVALSAVAQAYADTILALPSLQEWAAVAAKEPWVIDYPVIPAAG